MKWQKNMELEVNGNAEIYGIRYRLEDLLKKNIHIKVTIMTGAKKPADEEPTFIG